MPKKSPELALRIEEFNHSYDDNFSFAYEIVKKDKHGFDQTFCMIPDGNEAEKDAGMIACLPNLLRACMAAYEQENECYAEGDDSENYCLHCVLREAIHEYLKYNF